MHETSARVAFDGRDPVARPSAAPNVVLTRGVAIPAACRALVGAIEGTSAGRREALVSRQPVERRFRSIEADVPPARARLLSLLQPLLHPRGVAAMDLVVEDRRDALVTVVRARGPVAPRVSRGSAAP